MGYYPTPLGVVDRMRTFVRYPDDRVNLLDPCCGEGDALRRLAGDANAVTYGVELDGHRAEEAKGRLDHVLKCAYQDARISHDAFAGLFLNPPCDWTARSEDEASGDRTEGTFLRGTTDYLQPDGVLVYIIPQHRVTERVARYLAHRYGDLISFRFPDEDYEQFRQAVVCGVRKPEPSLAGDDLEELVAIPFRDLRELPYLDTPMYPLPPSPDVRLFHSTVIDETELERELRESRLWTRLEEDGRRNGRMGRPPLPLHSGHLGLLLASGYLDGVVGEGDERHSLHAGSPSPVSCAR